MTPEEALSVVDAVVERAGAAEQLEAVLSFVDSTEVRAHHGEVEHFVAASEVGLGVRVISEGRTGLSWAGVLDDEAIGNCVAEARDNARFASPDPHAGLADPDGVEPCTLVTVDGALTEVSAEAKVALAMELDERLHGAHPRIVGHEGADYSDARSVSAVASTTGVRAAEEETMAHTGIWALASDGEDVTTGFGISFGRGFSDLDCSAVVAEAVARSTGLLGATKAGSQRLTVVFDPYVTSQFLGIVAEMLSAEEVIRGRSPFGDRMGEAVAAPSLSLYDDPLDELAPTSCAVDGEGLACRRVSLLEDGRLAGFLHNAYSARVMGTTSTGSAARMSHRSAPGIAPRVLTPAPGSLSAAELHSQVGDGLLVQELAGLHSGVNPTSGDLSVGDEGVRLRDGAPAEPVREVTIASSIQRMLADVVGVGGDLRRFPWESAGVSLAIADVTMSGN